LLLSYSISNDIISSSFSRIQIIPANSSEFCEQLSSPMCLEAWNCQSRRCAGDVSQ